MQTVLNHALPLHFVRVVVALLLVIVLCVMYSPFNYNPYAYWAG